MFLIKTVVVCKNKDDNFHKSKAQQITAIEFLVFKNKNTIQKSRLNLNIIYVNIHT